MLLLKVSLFFMKFWESELQQKLSRKRSISVRMRSLYFGVYAQFTCAVACSTGDGVLCTVQCQVTQQVAWEQQVAVVCSLHFNGNYSCLIVGKQFLSQMRHRWTGRANRNGLSALIFFQLHHGKVPWDEYIYVCILISKNKENRFCVTMGTGEGTSDEEYFQNVHSYYSCFNLKPCFPFVVATHAYIYLAFF